MSDKSRLVYSTDKAHVVAMARSAGMSDAKIFGVLVANVYGKTERRNIICEWAPFLGLSQDEAITLAEANALI